MCIAPLKSMTYAMKAQRALAAEAIHADIVKLEPWMTKKGCAYGLRFLCANQNNVMRILDQNRITYSDIFVG